MQRRRFFKVSGLSAASLLFIRANPFSSQRFSSIRLPDSVSVKCSGEWIALQAAHVNWKYQDIEVSFQQKDDFLSLFIQAPQRELEEIRCAWKQNVMPSSKSMNDHWERSYGDLSWETSTTPRRSPWYLLISDNKQTQAFGVKTGANSICSWQLNPDSLELYLDTHSGGMGVLLGERRLHAADIITTDNLDGENPYHTDIRFCKMMCEKPRFPKKPVYGINDWYFAYGNNSRALILDTTKRMAELVTDWNNAPYSVIDMGWSVRPLKNDKAYCWGDDFTRGNNRFGDMADMAVQVKKTGMLPGLWTRPLLANAKDNQDLLIPLRKAAPDPKERYLDPTIPENLQRIGHTIDLYRSWGYHLVKHDFTSYDIFGKWGFDMKESMTIPGWHFRDRTRTNAEIILTLYQTIRESAKEMYLIGCNTISHLSAGLFEMNRIGDDTSGNEWARTLKMGVNTLGFRLPQHNAFYAADGDCVGLTTKIPWEKNKQWLQLLAESSAPLFISAQPEALGTEQKDAIKKAYARAALVQPLAEPLDWMTNSRPAEWKLNGEIVHFDWT